MATLFTCELNDCGHAFARSAWGRYNGLFTAADGDPRYFAGKLATPKATAYVALMIGRQRSQLDIIEVVAMQDDMVVADAAALAQGIDRDGKVSVYGIHFDTDKADIKRRPRPTAAPTAGRGAFAHTAYNDFQIVAAHLLDNDPRKVSDRIMTYALFIDPPLGRAGMTAAQVTAAGRKAVVGMRPMERAGRADSSG